MDANAQAALELLRHTIAAIERVGILTIQDVAAERILPSVLYRPRIYIDGNKWCALYGDNLQDGVAGFGDSPSDAMVDFNVQWEKALTTK